MATIIKIDHNSITNDAANSGDFVKNWNILWQLQLKRVEAGVELQAVCKSPDNKECWNSNVELKFGLKSVDEFTVEFAKCVKFSNFTNTYTTTLVDQKLPFFNYAMSVDVKSLNVFKSKLINKWLIPVPNITDTIFIVENQRIHVCKKFLAQYSTYFYDLFYGDDAKNAQQYNANDVTCTAFCFFLGLLHDTTLLTYDPTKLSKNAKTTLLDMVETVSELSFRFKADQCLEDCEKFFINVDLKPVEKLVYAQGLNFDILHDHVLQQLTTVEDVLNLETEENFKYIGQETKALMFDRMAEINRAEPALEKVISNSREPYTVETTTIGGVPFKFVKEFGEHWNITIYCNWKDLANPWRCQTEICEHNKNYRPLKELKTFDATNSKISIQFSSPSFSIKVLSMTGIFEPRSTAFTEIRPNLTDIVLSVGDKKYHVSKQILARSSTYFYTMFYSDFMEKDRDEIELKDIDNEEFEEFIQMVYHPSRNVSEDNIEGLLKLAQMYGCEMILKKCEKVLIHEHGMNDAMKIKMSEIYHFKDLYNSTIAKVKTIDDLEKLSKLDGFDEISKDTIADITLNILKNKQ